MVRLFSVLLSCLLCWQAFAVSPDKVVTSELTQLVNQLPKAKLKSMPALLEKIAVLPSDKSKQILQNLLNGELYYVKSTKKVVRAVKGENKQYQLTVILSGESLLLEKSKIKKIRTNNRIRTAIRNHLARLELTSANKATRIKAVEQILAKPSEDATQAISTLVTQEQDPDVAELMNTVLYTQQLKSGTHQEKLDAIEQLKDSLQPVVKNTMVRILESLPEKDRNEEEKQLALALTKVVEKINSKRDLFEVIE